jgi:hypothetical protein
MLQKLFRYYVEEDASHIAFFADSKNPVVSVYQSTISEEKTKPEKQT